GPEAPRVRGAAWPPCSLACCAAWGISSLAFSLARLSERPARIACEAGFRPPESRSSSASGLVTEGLPRCWPSAIVSFLSSSSSEHDDCILADVRRRRRSDGSQLRLHLQQLERAIHLIIVLEVQVLRVGILEAEIGRASCRERVCSSG